MTTALCTNCGNLKFGAYLSCEKCGCGSTGNMDLDMAFTDHYVTERTLREFGQVVQTLRFSAKDEATAFWAFMKYVSEQYPEIIIAVVPLKYQKEADAILDRTQLPEVFVEDSPRLDTIELLAIEARYASHVRHHKIECESCGHPQSFAVWSRINGSFDPWLKMFIVTGRLFENHCRCCGHRQRVVYETLYLDIDLPLAIWLRNSDCKPEFKIQLPALDYFSGLSSDFTFRMVPGLLSLSEKILIFGDGYDDMLIEFLKLCVSIQNGIDLTSPLFYEKTNRKFFSKNTITFLNSSQEIEYPCQAQKANAIQAMTKLQPMLSKLKSKWLSVDRQFLVEILEKAGLMKPIDI